MVGRTVLCWTSNKKRCSVTEGLVLVLFCLSWLNASCLLFCNIKDDDWDAFFFFLGLSSFFSCTFYFDRKNVRTVQSVQIPLLLSLSTHTEREVSSSLPSRVLRSGSIVALLSRFDGSSRRRTRPLQSRRKRVECTDTTVLFYSNIAYLSLSWRLSRFRTDSPSS